MSGAPSPPDLVHRRGTALRLLMLTFGAGSLDAISYLQLGQVFVAFMTGNTVLLGLALGQMNLALALHAGLSLFSFCVGVAAGALLGVLARAGHPQWPAALSLTVGIEAVLIVVGVALWTTSATNQMPAPAILVLLSAAMGLQSVGVQRLQIPFVTTTFVTGTLTSTVARLTTLFLPGAMLGATGASARGVLLPAAVFVVYGLGAVAGGAATLAWGRHAAWIPVAALILVLAVDAAARLAVGRPTRPRR